MLNRIHFPLGLCAPVKKDPEPAKAASPPADSFAAEAARSVLADLPAKADDIPESEISEKRRAGLTRDQAITVINLQRAEDAAKKAGPRR